MASPASVAISAQLMLAQQYEREGRHQEAAALVRDAAHAGDANAQYLWATRQIFVGLKERDEAVALIRAAATQGHPQALHLWAVLAAAGFGRKQDWRAAMEHLNKSAERGDPRAQAEIALLGPPQKFNVTSWVSVPPPRMAFTSPRIGVIESFLAPEFCDWVVFSARQKRMQRAHTVDPATGTWLHHPGRTNTGVYLNILEADVITRLIKARIGSALGLPVNHQEDANILRYEVGQTFDVHVDGLDPEEPGYAHELATLGQRSATFLIYLSDDFDGGETAFPALDWSYRGKKGDAIFFWNVTEEGALEKQLLHAGRPPTRGEKWLFSQWVRDRPIEGVALPARG